MTRRSVPLPARVVVAGTRSGVGKTSVAVGLMAALARRGVAVSNHKAGPDFLDPGYHAVATGRPPRNLDVVLHGADTLAPLLAHQAAGAEVAVVEGVMGMFDGRDSGDEASTAHVARLLDAPVVLVVDASASSRSVAAEVHGFATFDPTVRVGGVIVNEVWSDGHERMVREALAPLDVPVLGVVRHHADLVTPSRHLGLIPAAERDADARRTVAALADVVTAGVDLDAVVALARSAPRRDVVAWSPDAAVGSALVAGGSAGSWRPVVAVAGGAAFTFTYAEHAELLAAAGCDVVTFDPLADEALPDGTAAIVIGGGFPETHLDALAANVPLRRAVAGFGGPIVAECGGLLYLCRSLDGVELCGVLDAEAVMSPGLVLGYRDVTAATDSVLGPAGTRATGHEFHRTVVTPRAGGAPSAAPAWDLGPGLGQDVRGAGPLEGFVTGNVHASYVHTSWVGQPALAVALAASARRHAADGPASTERRGGR